MSASAAATAPAPAAPAASSGAPMQLDLRAITSRFDPFDPSVPSVSVRYPGLAGGMLMAKLRSLYVKQSKLTIPWFTPSGKKHSSVTTGFGIVCQALGASLCALCSVWLLSISLRFSPSGERFGIAGRTRMGHASCIQSRLGCYSAEDLNPRDQSTTRDRYTQMMIEKGVVEGMRSEITAVQATFYPAEITYGLVAGATLVEAAYAAFAHADGKVLFARAVAVWFTWFTSATSLGRKIRVLGVRRSRPNGCNVGCGLRVGLRGCFFATAEFHRATNLAIRLL